jgi:hypothetical protein
MDGQGRPGGGQALSTGTFQRAITLSCVTADGEAAPAGFRLFLPPSWSEHAVRRERAGVPTAVAHSEPWAIAMDLVDAAVAGGAPVAPICAAGTGASAPSLAMSLRRRGLGHAIQTPAASLVVPADFAGIGGGPLPAHEVARRAGGACVVPLQPDTLEDALAPSLSTPPPSLAVLEAEGGSPTYWLTGGPGSADPDLLAEAPFHAEAMYDDAAARAGLDSYAGRGWVGFHHHAALCMAAYAFLVSEGLEGLS